MKEKGFSSRLGFVLAAAGSAVGLGNIWRFPYLAAKYGGGIFLLIYLILTVTFGFALMLTEIAIGRKTGKSPLAAYSVLDKRFGFLGVLASIVPIIIFPYYCVIGGWVLKYFITYIQGQAQAATGDTFFSGFIGQPVEPMMYAGVFLFVTAVIVMCGVQKGVENMSKILMPILVVLCVGIAIYVATLPGSAEGFVYYLKPDLSKFSFNAVLAAMGQLFYSMSLAMGIMITYGSYVSKKDNIEKSVRNIEIFDTGIAFLAGAIIVPAVYTFSNGDPNALSQGPGLMFVTLPKVFADMQFGSILGTVFFLLVIFAALTSSISLMEAIVSIIMEKFKIGRIKACVILFVIALIMAVPSSLGNGVWGHIKIMGFAFLDFFDFISNAVLMPIVALGTCLIIGWVVGTKKIEEEVEVSETFKSKKLYNVLIKYIAPVMILLILISSVLNALGIITL